MLVMKSSAIITFLIRFWCFEIVYSNRPPSFAAGIKILIISVALPCRCRGRFAEAYDPAKSHADAQ